MLGQKYLRNNTTITNKFLIIKGVETVNTSFHPDIKTIQFFDFYFVFFVVFCICFPSYYSLSFTFFLSLDF
jgi:uncharacterized membrane protein